MITRIAPTPSGYLHVGNCVNFLLVDWLARGLAGQVNLRIDDVDAERYRTEYVDDIFRVLPWLAIDWQQGPRSRSEFEERFASRDRVEYYRSHLAALEAAELVYACECSRADLRAADSRSCVKDCAGRHLPLVAGSTALRARVPSGTRIEIDGEVIDVEAELGDFVVWRRDDLPAYQLASLIEDRDAGITHVVRGRDLLPSTAAQLFLAPTLSAGNFSRAMFVHHDLVTGSDGSKLSKSQLGGGPMELDDDTYARIVEAAAGIALDVGLTPGAAPR